MKSFHSAQKLFSNNSFLFSRQTTNITSNAAFYQHITNIGRIEVDGINVQIHLKTFT